MPAAVLAEVYIPDFTSSYAPPLHVLTLHGQTWGGGLLFSTMIVAMLKHPTRLITRSVSQKRGGLFTSFKLGGSGGGGVEKHLSRTGVMISNITMLLMPAISFLIAYSLR